MGLNAAQKLLHSKEKVTIVKREPERRKNVYLCPPGQALVAGILEYTENRKN